MESEESEETQQLNYMDLEKCMEIKVETNEYVILKYFIFK